MNKSMMTRGIYVAFATLVACGDSVTAEASHCREVRRSYDARIDQLEDQYRASRRATYEAYECEREQLERRLRHAIRHHHSRDDVRAIKDALRCAHRDVHDRLDAMACEFRDTRKALVRERDAATRACRNGHCVHCQPVPPVCGVIPQDAIYRHHHQLRVPSEPPGPRSWSDHQLTPAPTPWHADVRNETQPAIDWLQLVALLMNR